MIWVEMTKASNMYLNVGNLSLCVAAENNFLVQNSRMTILLQIQSSYDATYCAEASIIQIEN